MSIQRPDPGQGAMGQEVYDFVVIGSGFGGSVSAMRLAQKGYSVLVLERGRRYEDADFPKTNWNLWKSLWFPLLRCFGLFEMSFMNGVTAMHGSGVGGGSLMYGNVLLEPDESLFDAPTWRRLADWKALLKPHYAEAKRMLGVAQNPRLLKADEILLDIARDRGTEATFRPTEVAVFFGPEGVTVPDPYFGGEGPDRAGCTFCGGCLVGCRENAKNALPKNYLYFAEKKGARIVPEVKARAIRALPKGEADSARYEVEYRRSTAWWLKPAQRVRARNVLVAAGALGTLELLLRCRDVLGTLPRLSRRLGEQVRTNSENLQGVTAPNDDTDFSKGIAITSIFHADEWTRVEPVRYSDGSSFIRILATPLVDGDRIPERFLRTIWEILKHPFHFVWSKTFSPWARRSTILLMMQPTDELTRLGLGRNPLTLFRRGLVFKPEGARKESSEPPPYNDITRAFAKRSGGNPEATFMDSLLNYPVTAHLMGGVPFGRNDEEGVIGLDFQVHNYPGLYVVDGTVMPGNPGVNPSLTIAALSEYAMSQVPEKGRS